MSEPLPIICIDCGRTVYLMFLEPQTSVRCLTCTFILENIEPEDEETFRKLLDIERQKPCPNSKPES